MDSIYTFWLKDRKHYKLVRKLDSYERVVKVKVGPTLYCGNQGKNVLLQVRLCKVNTVIVCDTDERRATIAVGSTATL